MANRMIEWNLNYIAGGQLCTNVTHWVSDVVETDLWKVAKAFNSAVQSPDSGDPILEAIQNVMSEEAFISSSTARVLEPAPGTKAITVYALDTFPGTIEEEIFSQSVAGVMKLVTASGPDLTGRTFFPAVPETSIVQGRFSNDYRTAFNALMAAFAAGIITEFSTWDQVVYKRLTHTYEAVTNRQLNPNPGTIRKRLLPV